MVKDSRFGGQPLVHGVQQGNDCHERWALPQAPHLLAAEGQGELAGQVARRFLVDPFLAQQLRVPRPRIAVHLLLPPGGQVDLAVPGQGAIA